MDGAKKCVSLSAQFFSCVFLGKNNQNSSPTLRPSLRDPGCVTDEYDTVDCYWFFFVLSFLIEETNY